MTALRLVFFSLYLSIMSVCMSVCCQAPDATTTTTDTVTATATATDQQQQWGGGAASNSSSSSSRDWVAGVCEGDFLDVRSNDPAPVWEMLEVETINADRSQLAVTWGSGTCLPAGRSLLCCFCLCLLPLSTCLYMHVSLSFPRHDCTR
jgi:hypothetical protein